ncbi:DUF167 domain-containing protein [Sphingobium sufflavum]|uniref:DUF167 domain-containing protein n=1 Tax=Sphingobium sufflavum TaxID=1129547 RepID=UPI001F191474|nr:DUF167 domain-containing protein [Sphingobium sufflavum]
MRLTPRASANRIGKRWVDADGQDWLSASVAAPPDKGRANAALILLLAKSLDLPRSSISLEAGDMSRLKRIRIARVDAATVENKVALAGGATE